MLFIRLTTRTYSFYSISHSLSRMMSILEFGIWNLEFDDDKDDDKDVDGDGDGDALIS